MTGDTGESDEAESTENDEAERFPTPMDRAFLGDDPAAGTLLLVRHGQQEWPDHTTATISEWVDPPLSELGRKQADCVGRFLASEPITAVYSSHLQRANDTGKAIAGHHGVEVGVIEELEEIIFYGKLDPGTRPIDVLGETVVRGARERFFQTRKWDAYPASESSRDFRQRVGYAMEGILTGHSGETVVVACHGGVINAYLAELLGTEADMFYRPVHASIHRLRFKDSTRAVDSLNVYHYLDAENLLSK